LCLFFSLVLGLWLALLAGAMTQPNQTPSLPVQPLTASQERVLFAFEVLDCWRSSSRWNFPKEQESRRLNAVRFSETLNELTAPLMLAKHYASSFEFTKFIFDGMILRSEKVEACEKFVSDCCEALDALHAELLEVEEHRKWELEHAKTSLDQFQWSQGVNGFVSFYHSEQEEYSPAEGGCWFIRRTPVACYPASKFWDYSAKSLNRKLLEAEASRLGLTLEGEEVPYGDGTTRKVRKICSCAPEADCEAFLETYPFSHAKTIAPRYE
jgi:hypothetical protein